MTGRRPAPKPDPAAGQLDAHQLGDQAQLGDEVDQLDAVADRQPFPEWPRDQLSLGLAGDVPPQPPKESPGAALARLRWGTKPPKGPAAEPRLTRTYSFARTPRQCATARLPRASGTLA